MNPEDQTRNVSTDAELDDIGNLPASQLRATAALHDRIAAANLRFGVKAAHASLHARDAAKLRRAAETLTREDQNR